MDLIKEKSKIEELKKVAGKTYEKVILEHKTKITEFIESAFEHLSYHDSISVVTDKQAVKVKIHGWKLKETFRAPIEFSLRTWAFEDTIDRLPFDELKVFHLSFDKKELADKELMENYFTFIRVLNEYIEVIRLHKDIWEEQFAMCANEVNFDEYYRLKHEIDNLTYSLNEEEKKLKEEKFNKIISQSKILFKEVVTKNFYYGGERFEYKPNVVSIEIIKRNKTKTHMKINFIYGEEVCYETERYTKYLDTFIRENLENIIIN